MGSQEHMTHVRQTAFASFPVATVYRWRAAKNRTSRGYYVSEEKAGRKVKNLEVAALNSVTKRAEGRISCRNSEKRNLPETEQREAG